MTVLSHNIILKSHPIGAPKDRDYAIIKAKVPKARNGEITVINQFMSVDPYMRGRMSGRDSYIGAFELGKTMEGGAVGVVDTSGHPEFKKGDWVLTMRGWREAFTAKVDDLRQTMLQKLDPGLIEPRYFLSVAGLTGLTAYAGLYKVADFKPGETVFVSGAAGAVGSIAVQLAKADGGFVIGTAGGKEKCDWLRAHGADAAIDYKSTDDLTGALTKAAPNGVDVYFDNVGGDALEAALNTLKPFGRIAACGMISQYNNAKPESGPSNLIYIVGKSLRMQGFIATNYSQYMLEYLARLGPLMAEGRIVQEETIFDGIENAIPAFQTLFTGDKKGKVLVKLT